jgi:hypothetical protein
MDARQEVPGKYFQCEENAAERRRQLLPGSGKEGADLAARSVYSIARPA